MKTSNIPTSFRHRSSAAAVPPAFEDFYRRSLRYRFGARMRTTDVARMYAEWAEPRHEPSMGLRTLKRAMRSLGHQHFHSNGRYFADVEIDQ